MDRFFIQVPRHVPRFQEFNKQPITLRSSQESQDSLLYPIGTPPGLSSSLRTTQTVFPQHALVETYFKLSQAFEAHERALSWETSPRAWLANVRAIEMEKGLIPVPAFSGFPFDVLRGAR